MSLLTNNDHDPAHSKIFWFFNYFLKVRVREIGPNSFEYMIEEWDYQDGDHGAEDIGYFIAETGDYKVQ